MPSCLLLYHQKNCFMGNASKKKALLKKKSKPSYFSEIRSGWRQKLPIIFFAVGFAVLMILFYIFWLSDYSQNNLQIHIVSVNARLSSFMLNIFGMKTTAVNEVISTPSFSISIAKGCDAIEAMALFAAALLSFPAKWHHKVIGFFSGILILFILNIGRVVSLFIIGIYFPKAFEIMHVEVWQVLFIIFAIGLWIFWVKWTRKGVSNVQ